MSIATKVGKNAFFLVKTVSYNQRTAGFLPYALRRQFESFILSPSNSKRFSVVAFFSFAVGLVQQASANSRRQFGGFVLSPSKCKRFTTFHILSLADVGGCLGVSFVIFLWFLLFDFSAYMKSYRRHVKLFFIESPCATWVQAQTACRRGRLSESKFYAVLWFFFLFIKSVAGIYIYF